jgi:ubiquinone/menaquinone biosynthesis C-methylase UbiE
MSQPGKAEPSDRYDTLAATFLDLACIKDPATVRLLVAGAGDGREALAIARQCPGVTAIEPNISGVIAEARSIVQPGDVTALRFEDGAFDVVYCYHVLEHVPDCAGAVSEMHRVLRPEGTLYIGVPNKRRLLAYVCSSDNSVWEKLSWNLKDLGARLVGRFENRYGAHAGFTSEELRALLEQQFGRVDEVTRDYYMRKWRSNLAVRTVADFRSLSRFIWPSIYFLCRK